MDDLPPRHELHHSCFSDFHLQLEKQLFNQKTDILRKVFICETASIRLLVVASILIMKIHIKTFYLANHSLCSRVSNCWRSEKTLI